MKVVELAPSYILLITREDSGATQAQDGKLISGITITPARALD
jgi:hypothetical protein